MPRIPEVPLDHAPPDLQAAFDMDLARDGVVLNTTRIAGHRPGIVLATKRLGQAIADSGLIDAQLRLLVNVRVAGVVGCPF